jgi:hypothetical protein
MDKSLNPVLIQYLTWQSIRRATLGDQGGGGSGMPGPCSQHPRLRCSFAGTR